MAKSVGTARPHGTSVRSGLLLLVVAAILMNKQLSKLVKAHTGHDLSQLDIRRLNLRRLVPRRREARKVKNVDETLERLYNQDPSDPESIELLVPAGKRFSKVKVKTTPQAVFDRDFDEFVLPPPVSREASRKREKLLSVFGGVSKENRAKIAAEEAKIAPASGDTLSSASATRVGVDREFFRQLRAVLRICVPNLHTKEVYVFVLHTFFLVMRTYLSVLVARLDGYLVKMLVTANGRGFLRGLGLWFALALPATYTNSMIRFLQSKLAIGFRTRLTRYVHDLYLNNERNYYKVMNLDNRLEAISQYVTTDVAHFCNVISELYSNLSKPLLDIAIFLWQIGRSLGIHGVSGMMIGYYGASQILRLASPPFGKLAAIETKLGGEFRNAHSRLIINAEEVAFYHGATTEESILNGLFRQLIDHTRSILQLRIGYSFTEDFILKYTWSALGFIIMAAPTLFGDEKHKKASTASKTQSFVSNRRLLLSLSDAGSRLMYSYKGIAQLAGQTSRVYSLISTLHLLNRNIYQGVPRPADIPADVPFYDLGHIEGNVVTEKGYIEFGNAPIVAPAPGQERGGEVLIKDLTLKIEPGQHLMVTGPNGVGKTAIARILAGMWPLFEGKLERPDTHDLMFLPQRPYLSTESLREQIIYPFSYPEHIASGRTDEDLMEILRHVHLAYLPEREGGWTTRKEWKDVLSGGEKQRMGMARLFYHRPRYAVLDECTSAVSTDVEGLMYAHAKDLGITLITISHRPSLFKYHKLLLTVSGDDGQYEITSLESEDRDKTIEQEIHELESKMVDVDKWHTRLEEIRKELSFSQS
ncbi:ATP-binding cassette long-chain fatty acid transporter pxa1 [Malassezia cuniculi]|uniref:ATP-binding cassette long-chain fatty acid transporter pxa1 n=1 Tax=Malassezia cuniculi TaxID=948313 RepID=A0AAF0EUE3_9BASI|nr:ATP-binding cassette long-chain fatty acid transporter pxa1 [Malassezia cuniculi]